MKKLAFLCFWETYFYTRHIGMYEQSKAHRFRARIVSKYSSCIRQGSAECMACKLIRSTLISFVSELDMKRDSTRHRPDYVCTADTCSHLTFPTLPPISLAQPRFVSSTAIGWADDEPELELEGSYITQTIRLVNTRQHSFSSQKTRQNALSCQFAPDV